MKDRKRIDECIKFGIVDTIIVSLMITLLFELLAHPLSQLFGLSGSTQEMIDICSTALHKSGICFYGYFCRDSRCLTIYWLCH